MCSFPLLAPEILGPERLKGVEEELRKGSASPFVQRGSFAVYLAVLILASPAVGWLIATSFRPASPLAILGLLAAVSLSALSYGLCLDMVQNRLGEHEVDSEVLFSEQEQMAPASRAILNPLEYHRVVRPALWVWVFWAAGIPFHVLLFAAGVLLPKGILGLIHLEQRLLASGVGLRSLIFGTGLALLMGGLFAQFLATFGH
jgi:hypothetical protein